ncbi:MAG: hypothetical protein ACLQVY_16580 [Limisphaerales bacterium]
MKGRAETNRYYLLPGSRRGARRQFRRNMIFCVCVGAAVSGMMAWVFWYING